jgi:RimJ/RimL family protein N-acetyltransferase
MAALRPGAIIHRLKHPDLGEVIFRYPKSSDMDMILRYGNRISKERTFLSLQGQRISVASGRAYLEKSLQGMKGKKTIHILVLSKGRLCGHADLHVVNPGSGKHTGAFGISMAKEFRNMGLGRILMELVLREARKNIRGLEIITLGVFGDNDVAKRMYRKFGFKRFGILPRGDLHAGKHVAHELMYKNVHGTT